MSQIGQTDFLGTLKRMYEDSRILFYEGKYYNCCYLCGYVLECTLKYILLKHGKKHDGQPYTIGDLKRLSHDTEKLNRELDDWLSMADGVLPSYRLEGGRECPYLMGKKGYPAWNPKYRYGDYSKWNEKEYCEKYLQESDYLFRFVTEMVLGGNGYDT